MAIDPVIAEILKSQGRLEAQVEMLQAQVAELMCEEASDDAEEESGAEAESEPQLATNPAIHSTMLDFDVPPIF